ncbi:glycosyltransferase [Micromonospora tarensis]|uniref:Glycosyltransferase family 1 protein n=1 Tax=Micromonospora tarensis TaxID=2806100 RepID=A0ABS1YAI5_9ACTN|nr:glycosyltransferase [Micromonospora tarensis]MBM0274413.1 glycosyltransferase family 1 protein [Micromonospora tarensis]
MSEEQYQAARTHRPDVIVHTHANSDFGHFVAEKMGVPRVVAELYPFYQPSRYYPNMALQAKNLPKTLNRLSHLMSTLIVPNRKVVDRWRVESLGLPLRRGRHDRLTDPQGRRVPMLHMFSTALCPPAPDWPTSVHNMGFPFLPARADYNPPEGLERFLAAGPPPVAVGFGSVTNPDPGATGRMIREAVVAAGVRAVVVRGGGGIVIDEPTDDMFVVDNVPFDWLNPRIAGMVYSGGTGTAHYALAAGVPTLPCPMFRETAMWAERVRRTGAGLAPIWQQQLTASTLAEGMRRLVADESLRAAAGRVRETIQAEPGTALAVEVVERAASTGVLARA